MNKDLVEHLFGLFERSAASDLEYRDGSGTLRLSRSGHSTMAQPPVQHASDTAMAPPASDGAPKAPASHIVTANLTGNFFRSSAPGHPPYAEIGMLVEEGQVLGLIETMKMLNEVEADCAGRIVSFAIGNGEAVQAGAGLVVIEALASERNGVTEPVHV